MCPREIGQPHSITAQKQHRQDYVNAVYKYLYIDICTQVSAQRNLCRGAFTQASVQDGAVAGFSESFTGFPSTTALSSR